MLGGASGGRGRRRRHRRRDPDQCRRAPPVGGVRLSMSVGFATCPPAISCGPPSNWPTSGPSKTNAYAKWAERADTTLRTLAAFSSLAIQERDGFAPPPCDRTHWSRELIGRRGRSLRSRRSQAWREFDVRRDFELGDGRDRDGLQADRHAVAIGDQGDLGVAAQLAAERNGVRRAARRAVGVAPTGFAVVAEHFARDRPARAEWPARTRSAQPRSRAGRPSLASWTKIVAIRSSSSSASQAMSASLAAWSSKEIPEVVRQLPRPLLRGSGAPSSRMPRAVSSGSPSSTMKPSSDR